MSVLLFVFDTAVAQCIKHGWLQVGSDYRVHVLFFMLGCYSILYYMFPGKTRLAGFNRHLHAVLPPPPQDAFPPRQRTNVRGILIILVSGDRDMGV